ncbi:MAG: serine/threonine-protein kinase [Burkholderiaceae bacterium]|nr:serine/threonine-protein kinase [Actinomycetota bacterium]NCX40910.1 serine/threonine-protein kinase [Burkholderiaceae bacterium]NDE54363.1 serine/threonine-protein kinase [Actinomycetota bacterium]
MVKRVLGDRYQLGAMIGTGGMSDVFIADDLRLHREVAIKVLRSDLARDPSFVTRFNKEALSVAALNHPGIVSVYDSGKEETPSGVMPYIVMEYVEGKTLREIIHKGERFPLQRAVEIVEGILTALQYSHKNGIVHRDIKPGNIMITDSGDTKVMDFGIARALADSGATLTSTWNIVGTAQYLSPEQATGGQADARSDLYSVGCLFYELVSGKPPFSGETPVAIAYQHVSTPLTPVTDIEPSLDPALNNFFSISLAKDPADRYQSANAMLKDLKKLAKGEGITTQIPRTKKPMNRNRIAALVLSLVVLIGGASFFVFNPNSSVIVDLPNVVGLTEAQAREQLSGFTITIQRAPDPRIPRDRVSNQLPLATTRVSQGSSVTLTLSDGPGDAIVPTGLIGKPLEEVRTALVAAGLRVSRTVAVDSEQEPGIVLKITPEPGSTVEAGTGVVLEIASGNVQVPQLIGVTEIEARTLLTQAGFLVKTVEAYDANQPIGVVLAQAPSGGETKIIGSSVTITVNKAPN